MLLRRSERKCQRKMLVCYCSSTLAGNENKSLFFHALYSSQKMIIKEIREFNQKLTQKGIRIIPVHISDKRALIYVYRPKVKRRFSDETTQIILKCKGYDCTKLHYSASGRLIQKLQSAPGFSKEEGLF